MDITARQARSWLVVPLVAALVAVAGASPAHAHHTLRHAAGGDFHVGVAVTTEMLNHPKYAQLIAIQFSSLTPKYEMSWEVVQPAQGNFKLGAGDQIVAFAQANNQHVYGYPLVWHERMPGWLPDLSGNALDAAMQDHITTLMQHWSGAAGTWEVATEIIDDNGQLRDTFWLRGLGPGYVAQAFQYARQADPGATLCLNDYGIEGINAKSTAYFNLVQDLLAQGVPVDCMGFQGHLVAGQVPGDMRQNLQRFANLGLDIWITQLDIRIQLPATQQELQQQAADYVEVFRICKELAACQGITLWGLHDGMSWIPEQYPGYGAPLLWDAQLAPKPAYGAVLAALTGGNGAGRAG